VSIPATYTRTAIILHWLIAALIIVNVALIWTVDLLPEDWIRPAVDTHKSIGITVLGLALMRWLWRATHKPPPLPAGYPGYERIASQMVHGLFYLLILALPLSGWMHDSAWKAAATHPMSLFGLVPWPRIGVIMAQEPAFKEHLHDLFGGWHKAFSYLLYVLLALHIGGALKHQLLDCEPELQRMWPARRIRTASSDAPTRLSQDAASSGKNPATGRAASPPRPK
jgi:cytochrome b561